MLRPLCCLFIALSLLAGPAYARPAADRPVIVREGMLRWADNGEEVALFGVNYYPPCSTDFDHLLRLGVDHEQAIRDDVAHFTRLGLDLLRLHVWDREISDHAGNLVDNEHLRLLDYLIAHCKRNGIYVILTPIAWWSTPNTGDGFSNSYTMHQMVTTPEARQAQTNFLAQFVRHRNRYTGLTYAEEPTIPAFELINEPLYPSGLPDAAVTGYINALAGAVRGTGCRKPLFYNGWKDRHRAVAQSTVDGCTFGWYPSGLVAGRSLRGDFLPRVADYPSMRDPVLAGKAIGVYEFDAADVPGSYMYPAMARSFRAGGAQFAAQFQYDPMALAPFNSGWRTHYLNLVFAPKKALSFLIASEAFHTLPRLKSYGEHPTCNRFGEFRVSHAEDLSERVGETVFLHSNDTRTAPPAPARLERVAGCGSSPLVSYEGTGAYFLDRQSPGVWRLEVYPDAVWVNEPFAAPSLQREVSRVYWREWPMRLSLPDLGQEFTVRRLAEPLEHMPVPGAATPAPTPGRPFTAAAGSFPVRPGVYLLTRKGARSPQAVPSVMVAPRERRNAPPVVWHEASSSWLAGRPVTLRATVAAPGEATVRAHYQQPDGKWASIPLRRDAVYQYAGEIPAAAVRPGEIRYRISVTSGTGALSFPRALPEEEAVRMAAIAPATLFAARADTVPQEISFKHAPGQTGKTGLTALPGGRHAVRMSVSGFGEENSSAGTRVKAVAPANSADYDTLVIRARATQPDTDAVEVGLVQSDDNAFGCQIPLSPGWRDVRVPLATLNRLWSTKAEKPDLKQLREISLIFGSWLFKSNSGKPHAVEVERIWVEQSAPYWTVAVMDPAAPVPLFLGDQRVAPQGPAVTQATIGGKESSALRLSVPRFGPPPDCARFRFNLEDMLRGWQGALADRKTLHLRMRAGQPATSSVEIVLMEQDGAPWGTVVPLTSEWQDVRLPLDRLPSHTSWTIPKHRGGPGDRFHPERLQALNVCFGAWLFPEKAGQPHAIEIEGIWLE